MEITGCFKPGDLTFSINVNIKGNMRKMFLASFLIVISQSGDDKLDLVVTKKKTHI